MGFRLPRQEFKTRHASVNHSPLIWLQIMCKPSPDGLPLDPFHRAAPRIKSQRHLGEAFQESGDRDVRENSFLVRSETMLKVSGTSCPDNYRDRKDGTT